MIKIVAIGMCALYLKTYATLGAQVSKINLSSKPDQNSTQTTDHQLLTEMASKPIL